VAAVALRVWRRLTLGNSVSVAVAIVTGGNSGIGRASAVALAASGFDVGITWHRERESRSSS